MNLRSKATTLCRLGVSLGLLCLIASALWAQGSVTSLRGRVSDPSGAAIAGASLRLENPATGFSVTRQCDASGEYQFHQLPAGRYNISVEAAGFARQLKSVELLVNQPATIHFTLALQRLTTVLEVSAHGEQLNSVDASMGEAMEHSTIDALPLEGRNVPELLSLQPGVLFLGSIVDQSHDSRGGATFGSRSDQGNVTLDGVDNNDQARGYAFTGVLRSTLDSVDEFRVTTAGFGAESGRSSGAQVGLVTRSGTNSLHGSLYEFNRNSLGEANDWFNKQAEHNSAEPNVPGKLIRNTFGASLGGPIRHNRAFFFINYEGQRTAEDQQQTLTVPTASMRAGNIRYDDANGAVQTLSPQQIAAMDPNCAANGTCPWGPGVDPNVTAMLNQYPLPNGHSAGDGLNTASFTWAAPAPAALNTYIARIDYNLSPAHRLFVRGNLQNDKQYNAPQFPGQPASSTAWDNSKGVVAGETWELSATLVNNLHYGFTRQGYASRGIGDGQYANFYNISPLEAETRTTLVDVPVQNFTDDLTWVRGRHTLQFGANYRLIHNHHRSDAMSYSYGYTNSYALVNAGIAGGGGSLDPSAFGLPSVAPGFANSYNFAMTNLTGLLDLVTTQANYQIAGDGNSAALLASGAMLDRNFKSNEFEYYLQDSWRPMPRLTVSFGLRHTLLETPYEIHGQQVQPTVDIDSWFRTRAQQAALGNSVQPDLSFSPSGRARGRKAYWPMQRANIAPRFSVAFSPAVEAGFWRWLFGGPERSSVRASYGIFYDHYGQGIVNSFDQFGSFALSESITNPTNVLTPDDSPRFTGLHDLPAITGVPASTITYPALAPNNPLWTGFAITRGLDDHMQTPYSHVVNLSLQRELPGSFLLEAAYIGRFGRHQLQQIDLAQPLDLVDPQSGMDYFSAATALSKQAYAGAASVAAIPYFENMFPDAAKNGKSATENIYEQVWMPGNETGSLYSLDILCAPGCGGKTNRFWPRQFASLYAWSSIGSSSYNAAQLSLLRRMSRDLQMELSYTFSKSLDMGSDAERTVFSSSTGTSNGSSFGAILNAWKPRLNYAPSDYDVRHLVSGSWVMELPVGRGRRWLGGSSEEMDRVIGGWHLSGIVRWTSGLPFSIVSGAGWGTNWLEKSNMVQTGAIHTHTHIDASGEPQVFAGESAQSLPLRNPYPGEAGQRNNFRGDGYFGLDSRLSKSWTLGEHGGLRFAWEVFNVTNSVRFDVNPLNSLQNMTGSGELGVYGATLTRPRIQQLSLRYLF
jgi:hypothetical protein